MLANLTFPAQTNIMLDVTDWLSVTEASERSGYHPNHIRHLIHTGEIVAVRKGFMWLIKPESLEEYVAKMRELGTAKHDPTRIKKRQ